MEKDRYGASEAAWLAAAEHDRENDLPFALWTAEDFARERQRAAGNRAAHFGRREEAAESAQGRKNVRESRRKQAGTTKAGGADGGGGGRTPAFALFASSVLLLTAVLSFLTWDPAAETGELYAATAALRDTLSDNEAVAVFLGLSGDVSGEEAAEDPAREAERDVRQALGLE